MIYKLYILYPLYNCYIYNIYVEFEPTKTLKSHAPTIKAWRVALERLEGAYSRNTLRAYRADMDVSERWCEDNEFEVLQPTPGIVAAFSDVSLFYESVGHLSGHSMRRGCTQDMIASSLSILPIMQAGGWKTMNVVARYVEKANLAALLERLR